MSDQEKAQDSCAKCGLTEGTLMHRPAEYWYDEGADECHPFVAEEKAQDATPSGPQRFRKKPVVIEAWQFRPGLSGYFRTDKLVFRDSFCQHPCLPGVHAFIQTLEGEMKACPGDWIIKGIKGEFYPVKPDIFEATYEPAPSGSERE